MTAHRYAGTTAAAYLTERFHFAFTQAAEMQPLEDHIWEVARRSAILRMNVESLAQSLIEDAGYVVTSIEKDKGRIYEAPNRESLATVTHRSNKLEADLTSLIEIHSAMVGTLRTDEQTWADAQEENTKLRQQVTRGTEQVEQFAAALAAERDAHEKTRAHLLHAKDAVTELSGELAAVRSRVTLLADQRAELERKAMNGADKIGELEEALATKEGSLLGARERVAELERELAKCLRQSMLDEDKLQGWMTRCKELETERDSARKTAEDFADERDDAERARRQAVDEYHEAMAELEQAKRDRDGFERSFNDAMEKGQEQQDRADGLEVDLTRMANQRDEALTRAQEQQNRAEELEEQLAAAERASQAR